MKKYTTTLLLAFLFSFNLSAQLDDGSIAPDFTATDINGNQHNLYDLLNEGKTVILDISATWCGPCWGFHTSGVLESLWTQYGPDGSDELFIMMIEADGSTTLADLYGTGNNTIGNWVEGIEYPIIDAAWINGLYDINYFPTLYQVCPDRTVMNLRQNYDPAGFYGSFFACNQLEGNSNASIRNFEEYNGATCGNIEYKPEFILQNMGTESLSSATIDVFVNGNNVESRNWVGNLNSYEYQTINLNTVQETGSFDFRLEINNVNGGEDDIPQNNAVDYTLEIPKVADNKGKVIINTDNYGNELYWILYSPQGQIIGSGGNEAVGLGNIDNYLHDAPSNPNAYPSNSEIIVDIELEQEGCYFLLISDYFGDGICCFEGEGSFKIVDSGGDIVLDVTDYDGNHNVQFERLFFSSTNEPQLQGFEVSPNPNQGDFVLSVDQESGKAESLTIIDQTGRSVYEERIEGNESIHLSLALNNGLYFAQIYTDKGLFTQAFVVVK